MRISELMEQYPEVFAKYAEQILDSYFGNLFVTWRNRKILYVNEKMARSVRMTKKELEGMSLEELRKKKLWLRSVSEESYKLQKPFDAYNVNKWGEELFTHIEPFFNEDGEQIMTAQYSIPRAMLEKFSRYILAERNSASSNTKLVDYLQSVMEPQQNYISVSQATQRTFLEAHRISGIDSTVLILGETGAGKDVLANYIHRNSLRAAEPLIPVNCSAIPRELMESEFFGYEKGAFTGARATGKQGFFELADKGTLFLDEVGELPLDIQAKLLRVLEDGQFMRVGGTQMVRTDVRIIAATNRNLKQMVAEHKFREDLFYRLNVITLTIPPLRKRTEDIIPLAESFLAQYNRKYGVNRELNDAMREQLKNYEWPGNVRELRNIIERFVIIERLDLLERSPAATVADPASQILTMSAEEILPLRQACSLFERRYIEKVLTEQGGSVVRAAEALGVHRSVLYRHMKELGITLQRTVIEESRASANE